MSQPNLVLAIPQGCVIATSLGIEGFARHRSPGAGSHFQGRGAYVELAVDHGKPAFNFLDEGGWRDAAGDTAIALEACASENKRTKTALSNNGFSITPIDAYRGVYLTKTGGQTLKLQDAVELACYSSHTYRWGRTLTPDEIAEFAGTPKPKARAPRLYMVLAPLEFVVLSNLTPQEYGWYSTHRPGKVFRQVMFTELKPTGRDLVAETIFDSAFKVVSEDPAKKTKTIYPGAAINLLGFQSWIGYQQSGNGGIYVGDREKIRLYQFPTARPTVWDRAD